MNDQEIEVKLFVRGLKKIEAGLLERKARLIQARVFERNLRFDLPDGSLRAQGQVLRLRQDTEARLTYKGPGETSHGVISRTELEFTISDLDTARKVLEALGYVQVAVYEKYRTTYELEDCHIMLDELPYGDFMEIEGQNDADIRSTAKALGLEMKLAIQDSYLGLYEKLAKIFDLPKGQLTFEVFHGKTFSLEQVNVHPVDSE